MANTLPDYSSRQVKIGFFDDVATGLADTGVTMQRNQDITSTKVGMSGEPATSINPDRTGQIELTVDQSSALNILLSGVVAAEEVAGKKARGAFTVEDPSGGAIAKLARVHIQGTPTVTFASERQDRTWTLFVEDYIFLAVPTGFSDTAGIVAEVAATLNNIDEWFL
tara:strand:- start:5388 stop:5888 length:501 start_codon:yes stop_codon:yes gene_type:complete